MIIAYGLALITPLFLTVSASSCRFGCTVRRLIMNKYVIDALTSVLPCCGNKEQTRKKRRKRKKEDGSASDANVTLMIIKEAQSMICSSNEGLHLLTLIC